MVKVEVEEIYCRREKSTCVLPVEISAILFLITKHVTPLISEVSRNDCVASLFNVAWDTSPV